MEDTKLSNIVQQEETKVESQQKFLFQIPCMEGKQERSYVIGVIDASGSMSSYWNWLATVWNSCIPEQAIHTIITFDSIARIAPNKTLSTSISQHGGGMTNISEAFKAFEQELYKLPSDAQVTCIFISDGEDNHLDTLETRMSKLQGNQNRHVNFICLGVQSGFPTFLSMSLRKLYHNGDESIPALYLIEYASEKAFFNKFQTILPFLKGANLLDVIPPCRIYPWEEPKTELYEGSWVITEENYVCINDQKFEVDPNKVSIENLVEIFRNWLQNLHLICLKDAKDGVNFAKITLKEMHNQCDIYAKSSGIDLRIIEAKDNQTFYNCALTNFMKNVGQRVNWFIAEIDSLAKGNNPKDQSEFEAAKRLQLGTITGKHQQKALALKNISITDFKQIKENFLVAFKETQTKMKTQALDKQVYPYCQETIRKLFLEDKFTDAFEYCSSQYDLFDALALPGISLNIKKTNGFDNNPWLIQVKKIKLINQMTDSAKIINNSMLLTLPIPNSEEKEEINCCLPLFTPDNLDILPVFSHQLVQMIISYLITANADAFFEDSYYSLLAHAYAALITDKQIQNYQELENGIFDSFEFFYQEKVQLFAELLEKNPHDFFNCKSGSTEYTCSISKSFLLISYLGKKNTTSPQALQKMFDHMLMQWCYEFIKQNNYNAQMFFTENFDKVKIIEECRKKFDKSLYLSHFKKQFINLVKGFSTGTYAMNEKALNEFDNEIELKIIEELNKKIFNEEVAKNKYIVNIHHSMKHKNLIFKEEPSQSIEEAKAFFIKSIGESEGKGKKGKKQKHNIFNNFAVQDSFKQLIGEFQQNFMETHQEVLPLSNEEIMDECKARNIDYSQIKFSTVSKLPQNMCLSPKCKFYFQVLPESKDKIQTPLKKHLDNWQGLKPHNFHAFVKSNINLQVEEIYNLLKSQNGFSDEKYKVSKEFTLQYIEKVRSKYLNIKA